MEAAIQALKTTNVRVGRATQRDCAKAIVTEGAETLQGGSVRRGAFYRPAGK